MFSCRGDSRIDRVIFKGLNEPFFLGNKLYLETISNIVRRDVIHSGFVPIRVAVFDGQHKRTVIVGCQCLGSLLYKGDVSVVFVIIFTDAQRITVKTDQSDNGISRHIDHRKTVIVKGIFIGNSK